MRSRDTSDAAREVLLEVNRSMTAARRLELALSMSDEMMAVTRAGIRHRHPAFTEDQVLGERHRILAHDALVG